MNKNDKNEQPLISAVSRKDKEMVCAKYKISIVYLYKILDGTRDITSTIDGIIEDLWALAFINEATDQQKCEMLGIDPKPFTNQNKKAA